MPLKTHKYTNGSVTIIWKPDTCIHSGICARGLIQVFDPKRKPWIDTSQADTESIIEQVKQCPSGALSFIMNNENSQDAILK
ncbi:MAG: (4Fe-4S)-binding protein [Ferruginibacter sp.]